MRIYLVLLSVLVCFSASAEEKIMVNGYGKPVLTVPSIPAAPAESTQPVVPLEAANPVEPAGAEQLAAAPATAALSPAQPSFVDGLEHNTHEVLGREDGVSAAIGAALTATITSNPGAVLIGGLAGIWVGEEDCGYEYCKKMKLGKKTSQLFRRVAGSVFKGGRALVSKTKQLAKITGEKARALRKANQPMPLGEQPLEATAIASTLDAPQNTAAQQMAPEPVAAEMPQKARSITAKTTMQAKAAVPVISASKQASPKKTKVKASSAAKSASKIADKANKRPTAIAKSSAANAVKKSAENKTQTKTAEPQQSTMAGKESKSAAPAADSTGTDQGASEESIAQGVVKENAMESMQVAQSKQLTAMPKVNSTADTTKAEKPAAKNNDRPWPEPPAENIDVKTAQSSAEKISSPWQMPSTPPLPTMTAAQMNQGVRQGQAAQANAPEIKQASADCDSQGSKISRGRLAWMECYYRMGQQ